MASNAEELASRKTSATSNHSELDRRGSSPAIYDLNEGKINRHTRFTAYTIDFKVEGRSCTRSSKAKQT